MIPTDGMEGTTRWDGRVREVAPEDAAEQHEVIVEIPDAAATHELGRRLAQVLRAGDLVILSGELGAGKTTLARGIGAGLEVRGDITSPTFVISRVHPSQAGGPALVHVDAYRLAAAVELDDLDLDTTAEAAVTVVEWGDGVAESLADDRLHVRLDRALGRDGERAERGDDAAADTDADDDAGAELRVATFTPVGARWVGSRLASTLLGSAGSRWAAGRRESGP